MCFMDTKSIKFEHARFNFLWFCPVRDSVCFDFVLSACAFLVASVEFDARTRHAIRFASTWLDVHVRFDLLRSNLT